MSSTASTTATPTPLQQAAYAALAWVDPREQIEVGVLLPNGKLVGRTFTSREQAEAWARPEEGEQVVEFNAVCDCNM